MQKLIHNTSWLVIGQFFSRVLKFIFLVVVARLLGFSEYGVVVGALAFLSLFGIAASFFHTLTPIQRIFALANTEEGQILFRTHLSWRITVASIFLIIAVPLAILFGHPVFLTIILGVSLMIDFVRDMGGIFFQGKELMREEAIALFVQSCTVLAGLSLFFILPHTALLVAWCYLFGSLLGLGATYFFLVRRGLVKRLSLSTHDMYTKTFFLERVRDGSGFGLTWMLLVTFSFQWIITLLGFTAPDYVVGAVGLCIQLVQVALVPFAMLGSSALARALAEEGSLLTERLKEAWLIFLGVGTFYVSLFLTAFWVVTPFFKKENSIFLLSTIEYLLPAVFFGSGLILLFYFFLARNLFGTIVRPLIVGFLSFFILSFFMNSSFGVPGLLLLLSFFYLIFFFLLWRKMVIQMPALRVSSNSLFFITWVGTFLIGIAGYFFIHDFYVVRMIIILLPSLFLLNSIRAMVRS